nr:type II toxin-antitoxin system PemK/MazF family toxin [Lacticaseibacillus absianus]
MAETSPFAWVVSITHGQWAYPTHISLDGRTKTDGTIYVERLLTIDHRICQPRFLEKLPADKLADVLHLVHELTRP